MFMSRRIDNLAAKKSAAGPRNRNSQAVLFPEYPGKAGSAARRAELFAENLMAERQQESECASAIAMPGHSRRNPAAGRLRDRARMSWKPFRYASGNSCRLSRSREDVGRDIRDFDILALFRWPYWLARRASCIAQTVAHPQHANRNQCDSNDRGQIFYRPAVHDFLGPTKP